MKVGALEGPESLPGEQPEHAPKRSARSFSLWATRGGLTIVDQALISGSNFLANVWLARLLEPAQYGAYAIAMALYLLLANVHQALLLEPYMVLNSDADAHEGLGTATVLNTGFGAAVALLLGVGALGLFFAGQAEAAYSVAGLALAAPCIFIFWLFRASLYLHQNPGTAVIASTCYCVILAGGVALASAQRSLSPFMVLVCMALAATVAAVLILGIRRGQTGWQLDRHAIADAARGHWSYGRWALGTAGVMWAHINGFTPAVGMLIGIREAGAFGAVMNFFLPVGATFNALGRLFLPIFSRTYVRQSADAVWRRVLVLLAAVIAGTILYAVVVTVFRTEVFHLFYGGRFDAYANLVPIVLFSAVLSTGAATTDIGLRAIRAPRAVFTVNAAAAFTSLVIGWPATSLLGLSGTAACLVCSGAAAQLMSLWLLRNAARTAASVEV